MQPVHLTVTKDPEFPNENDDRSFWRGETEIKLDTALVTMQVEYITGQGFAGFRNHFTLKTKFGTAFAEGSSPNWIGLVRGKKSVGYMCQGYTVKPSL